MLKSYKWMGWDGMEISVSSSSESTALQLPPAMEEYYGKIMKGADFDERASIAEQVEQWQSSDNGRGAVSVSVRIRDA